MARIEHTNPDTQSSRWGQGFERFGFPTTDQVVQAWYKQARLPRIITPDDLAGAPAGAIGLIRDIAFLNQAEPLKVSQPEVAMRLLTEHGVTDVGRISTRTEDGARTTNHIIPLTTNDGLVEIIVNSAWGIHWRVSEDHPLAAAYPALTRTHMPDMSLVPEDTANQDQRYIAPETLAAVTEPIVRADEVAREMHSFLQGIFNRSRAPQFYTRNAWNSGAIDTELSAAFLSQELGGMRMLKLLLGNKTGLKTVQIDATRSNGVRSDLDWIYRQAEGLARKINLFTGYNSTTRR